MCVQATCGLRGGYYITAWGEDGDAKSTSLSMKKNSPSCVGGKGCVSAGQLGAGRTSNLHHKFRIRCMGNFACNHTLG